MSFAGYCDYGDRLIVEASVRAAGGDSLAPAGCEFLGGKREAPEATITAELPESLADAEQGKDVSKSFDTVEDLMEDLKK